MKPARLTPAALALLLALPAAAGAAPLSSASNYPTWDGKQESAHYSTPDSGAALREYTQSSSMRVRQSGATAAAQQITYREAAELPLVRSGNLEFDALFALATTEMRQASVSEIRDGSYNDGKPIPCDCFETGEQWHYVWTRDLSYAAALGLATLDPQRVRNSLQFKLSGYRAGITPAPQVAGSADGLQIIQDTGSGGSWPISTDRVSWAFGAEEALKALPATERKAFAPIALRALSNTIDNDRLAAYDQATGLYTGEQSFLDWREQSYAAWTPGDLASMGTAKALSTNVGHYKALTLAAQLAREQGDTARAARYTSWAADLKQAINRQLWLADAGMYSSLTAGHFDGVAMHKFDWLGQTLAIVTGIATERQARSILAHYPHGPMGAPVIFPQQQDVAVYHNRAIWPFVTAYGLKAAALAGNAAVADAAYDTLIRGAALNLSNMENLEWLSGQPMLDDTQPGNLSGPVINSRRQLWSVGAYLGMVVGQVFGISTTDDGIRLQPFITAKLRRTIFAGSDSVTLSQLRLQGKRLQVTLRLPAASAGNGHYAVTGLRLNGQPLSGTTIAWDALSDDSRIEIQLGQLVTDQTDQQYQQDKRSVSAAPLARDHAVFAPREPRIASVQRGSYGIPLLQIADDANRADASDIYYNIYRDGQLAAQRVTTRSWPDRRAGRASSTACYALEAVYASSGNRSHHSAPACLTQGQEIVIARGGLKNWGAPTDRYTLQPITIRQPGHYALQYKYRNTANQINLGISAGVKWAVLKDQDGQSVAQGVVQLPHTSASAAAGYSTPLQAELKAGRYSLTLSDFTNMSYLQSNTSFTAAGGLSGLSNRVDLYALRVQPLAASSHGTLQIIDNFAAPQLGNQRALRIYLPPSYGSEPARRYPVLYMHDGQNLFDASTTAYGTAWDVGRTMDRLIANGDMAEAIVVGIDNTPDRIAEYTPCCDPQYGGGKLDAYQAFITDTVKPYIDARLRTLPGRQHTAIMGSSLGGIASVYIAQRRPDLFAQAGGVSSSFWWNRRALLATASTPSVQQPLRYYLDAGTNSDGLEDSLAMRDALQAKGYQQGKDLYFYTAEGGVHNEQSWAARLHLPLTWFFPATPR